MLACGEIGLNINYFYSLTPREFYNILTGYNRKTEAEFKTNWEQTRQLMFAVLQPHVKKGSKLEFTFPWEKQDNVKKLKTRKTREQIEAEFKKLDEDLKKQNTTNG